METLITIQQLLNSSVAHSLAILCFLLLWIAAGLYVGFNVTLTLPAGFRRLSSLALPFVPALILLSIYLPLPLIREMLGFTIWLSAFKLTLLCFGKHIDTWTKWPESSFSNFALAFLMPVQIMSDSRAPLEQHLQAAVKTVVQFLAYAAASIFYLQVSGAANAGGGCVATFLAGSLAQCVLLYIYIDFPNRLSAFCLRLFYGVETLPIFDDPWLSSSITDFWGKRWDLIANAMLRQGVYQPIIRRLNTYPSASATDDNANVNANPNSDRLPTAYIECTASQQLLRDGQKRQYTPSSPPQIPLCVRLPAVFATFVVSGVLHELLFLALSPRPLRRPSFRATAFFVLHGVATCVEICVRRATRPGASDGRCAKFLGSVVGHVPHSIKVLLTVAFAYASATWLFFPPLVPVFLGTASQLVAILRSLGVKVV